MNSKTILFSTLILSMLIIACNTKSDSGSNNNTSNFKSNIPLSCIIHENRRDGSQNQRLNSMCADSLIKNYQEEVDTLKLLNPNFPNIDNLLTYGARVELSEMYTIIEKIEDGRFDEVYTMMAAIPGKKSEIIFVLKNSNTNHKAYYNFTMPCPDACPGTTI